IRSYLHPWKAQLSGLDYKPGKFLFAQDWFQKVGLAASSNQYELIPRM
ncbi:unnamed protein product, partial [marine sediment metagenome]